MSFFSALKTGHGKIGEAFKIVFGLSESKKVEGALGTVASILQQVLPFIKLVAAITPTNTDDEIIAILEKYAVPLVLDYSKPLTNTDKAVARFQTVKKLVIDSGVAKGIDGNLIDSAIQLMYTGLKAIQK